MRPSARRIRSANTRRADVERWIGYCILVPFSIAAVCLAMVGDFFAAVFFVLPPMVAFCGTRWLRPLLGL